jgi:hypothetical protein
MAKTEQAATFKLKCVGCHTVETRPAAECQEQPFCKKCFLPMTLEEVAMVNPAFEEVGTIRSLGTRRRRR